MHCESANSVSTFESFQSCRTESMGHTNEGTHRTFMIVVFLMFPALSVAKTGRSPMHVHSCMRPSAPYIVSAQGLTLMSTEASLMTCQTHPLSTTKDKPVPL